MNQEELNEIQSLPNKYKPLTAWQYFGLGILFALPIVGLILTIIFAFDNSNINRRSYARSFFCVFILVIIISAIIGIFIGLGKITMPIQ